MSRGPPNIDGMVSLKVDNLSYRYVLFCPVRLLLRFFRTSTETLRRKFERYGEIGDAYVPRDRNTGGRSNLGITF